MDKKVLLKLHQKAIEALSMAYSPYSNFPVGVAILSNCNKIYAGCNVENAAYPQGQCAEAGAISSMILGGCTTIIAILIVGKGDTLCTPCGGCRQKIGEFASAKTAILIANESKILKEFSLDEILPYSFGSKSLR